MPSTAAISPPGKRGFRSLSTFRHIVVIIRIIRALPRMSAWPAIDSIYDMRRPCHVGGGLAVTDL
jgi:hypothetical protein